MSKASFREAGIGYRLPEHSITRRNYVETTFGAAVIPVSLLVMLSGRSLDTPVWLLLLVMSLSLPCALAWFVWPKNRRSAATMALCGAVIVFFSLFGGGVFLGFAFAVSNVQSWDTEAGIMSPFKMGVAGLFFGSVVTLGLPWILGIGLSLLFRDAPQ